MPEKQKNESDVILDDIVATPYKYGFTTDIEVEEFEKGLNLDVVKKISTKKNEPLFLQMWAFNLPSEIRNKPMFVH